MLGAFPSTSLFMTSRADQVYLVTRNVMNVSTTRSTCDRSSGTVTVMNFDSHVVGCHVSGGQACSQSEVDFVDSNRTKYQVTNGIIDSLTVPATATCADVRNALPM